MSYVNMLCFQSIQKDNGTQDEFTDIDSSDKESLAPVNDQSPATQDKSDDAISTESQVRPEIPVKKRKQAKNKDDFTGVLSSASRALNAVAQRASSDSATQPTRLDDATKAFVI